MEKRMGKNWIHVGTNDLASFSSETKEERARRIRGFRNMIRNTKSLDIAGLREEGDKVAEDAAKEKASYEKAKKEEKLLSQAEKDRLKARRKKMRRGKRLEKTYSINI